MGYRTKQRILIRRISNGPKTFKELLNFLNHQAYAIKLTQRYHAIPVRIAKIKITEDSLCWKGCGVKGTLLHCWWVFTLVHPLCKLVWWFHRKWGITLFQDLGIPILGIYLKDTMRKLDQLCS